jgi:hypothetical protein
VYDQRFGITYLSHLQGIEDLEEPKSILPIEVKNMELKASAVVVMLLEIFWVVTRRHFLVYDQRLGITFCPK